MSDHENMTADRIRQQMMVRNPDCVRRVRCSSCNKLSDEAEPSDWQDNGYYGWLCPDCQND